MNERRAGVGYGLAAYGMWGLFPLYWPLLRPAIPTEILAHRMVWSLLVVALLLALRGRWDFLRKLRAQPRKLAMLAAASGLIAVNWGVYIWAVNSGHVLDSSLGYFINPLVTVVLGVTLLGERLRRLQWAAVALGALAVLVLAVGYGKPPWIALGLAASFATYGLLKKTVGVPALESMAVETGLQVLPAAAYLAWLEAQGRGAFGHHSAGLTALLVGSGVLTAVPLLCFGASAARVPLSTLGLLQFLAPVLQFLCGAVVRREPVPPLRLAGFGIVWLALVVLSVDAVRALRGASRPG